jgi:carbonic anhydrase/acetyltransferase-like protein (isoleucine patch superfamily)
MIKRRGVYIMESAEILGDVGIGENSSVWSKVVIRGDESSVRIGKATNIQDMCVMHAETDIPMEIGDNVTIGHSAVVHCRRIGSHSMIGMGALVLDNAEIGEYSIIGAGAVVLENAKIPPRSIVLGIPGKVVREINDDGIQRIRNSALNYLRLAQAYYEGKYRKIS